MLETMKQIDSQLMMRNYEGFLSCAWHGRRKGPVSSCSASRVPARAPKPARLAEHYGVRAPLDRRHVPCAAAAGTAFGLEAKRVHGRGRARPRRDRRRWSSRSASAGRPLGDGFVLDGFPRTLAPGRELDRGARRPSARRRDQPRRPARIVLDRIAGRRVCENCGTGVPRRTCPRYDWTCDTLRRQRRAARRRHRGRDRPPAGALRGETVPIIDYYREPGQLVVVDGSATATRCTTASKSVGRSSDRRLRSHRDMVLP